MQNFPVLDFIHCHEAFCVKWNKRNIYVTMYCTTNDDRFWGLTLSSGFLRWNEIKSTLQDNVFNTAYQKKSLLCLEMFGS